MNILTIESSEGSLGKNKGCEKGPQKILEVLGMPAQKILVNDDNIEITHQNIYETTKHFEGLILGGDHSYSYSSIKSFMEEHPGAQLVVFDAHADCVNNINPPSHEDYLRVLIEEGIISSENILLIGTRAVDPIEEIFLKVQPIKHYPYEEIINNDEKLRKVLSTIKQPYYLSIDIDVLDPSVAPGTGYPEPNGLSLNTLKEYLTLLPPPKIMDLVEVNPSLDKGGTTINSAKEIIKTIFS